LHQRAARHDLLADDLDALIGETADRRAHQIGGNFLLFDEDGRGRSIRRRQQHRHGRADRNDHDRREEHRPAPPCHERHVFAEVLLLFWKVALLHHVGDEPAHAGNIVRSWILPSRPFGELTDEFQ
jgi:hypothetical protein